MAGGGGNARKVVLAALFANGAISIAKFVAAALSGSIAMVAEGVHSVADTANQALLLVGMGLSKKSDPDRFPLGRERETYFWAFVVSLMLFLLGGVYAIYEGVHKLLEGGGKPGSPVAPIIVLSVSLVIEGASFFVALREFNKFRAGRPVMTALFSVKDPTIPVVLLEDAGAVFGLAVALAAVVTSWLTGSTIYDGIGSLVIGVLLCAIGIVLAYDTHGLIIGEGASKPDRKKALANRPGHPRHRGGHPAAQPAPRSEVCAPGAQGAVPRREQPRRDREDHR